MSCTCFTQYTILSVTIINKHHLPTKLFLSSDLYCLGSWTTNGLVRLILADDERQRYSAWYKDYGAIYEGSESTTSTASALAQLAPTRSQQLGQLPASTSANTLNLAAQPVSFVDLQIALITPLRTITKPMQVRLTRRSNCSDLRGYSNQGSLSSVPSYASPSASSSANSINMLQSIGLGSWYFAFVLISVTIFNSIRTNGHSFEL